MADRVIVVGVKRGNERISVSEIQQMFGRAGRKHGGNACKAELIVEDDEYDEVLCGMESDGSFDIHSHFESEEKIAFHLLPEICEKSVRTFEDAQAWYSKSLGAFQGKKAKIEKSVDMLLDAGAIVKTPHGFLPTKLGQIASKMYFHPLDVRDWKDNFSRVFEMGLECDDVAVAWALGNTSVMRVSGDFGKYWHVVGECKNGMPPGLEMREGTVITITLWWGALSGVPVGKMRNHVITMRDDFERIRGVLTNIDCEITRWDMVDFFIELERRIKRGIPSYLAELCNLPNISKNRAEYLYNMGVRDAEGIKESLINIEGEVDENFAQALKDIANGVRQASRR
jgi:replicative superfamily II helicase